MTTLAVLSMHTSPLAQPGTGDGGGMNVYVRELCAGLARRGVRCEVFTRSQGGGVPAVVDVEPGFRLHHVVAGASAPVAKEALPGLVGEWTEQVADRLDALAAAGHPIDAIHANYWLSGIAGHRLKHRFGVPLLSTFHTLERINGTPTAPAERDRSERRQQAEMEIIGCSDVLLASCDVEADQLVVGYGAAPERIEIVPPGVDHAVFGPGDRAQARRAIGWPADHPLVLFVGRIQPLKGPSIAADAVGHAFAGTSGRLGRTSLAIIGGPSGPDGAAELAAVKEAAAMHRLDGRVHLLAPQRHERLATSYRAADVVVVPSRSESFGLVALEAAACGIPVVASAVGGLTTLVDHGRTGYLVERRDPRRFARYLRTLVTDPAWAATLGGQAAEVARHYTWSAAAARLETRLATPARQLVACS